MAKKSAVQHVNIGISDKDRKKIADGLSRLLAATATRFSVTRLPDLTGCTRISSHRRLSAIPCMNNLLMIR